jgi:hypothetical protein
MTSGDNGISELPRTQIEKNLLIFGATFQHLVFLVSEIDMIRAQIEELKGRVDKLEEHIKSHEGQKHNHSH